jgi:plasmid stabilization system protein ParE
MAEMIWTEPALQDLDAIADYIALDNPLAARRLVQRVCARGTVGDTPRERLASARASTLIGAIPPNR